MNKFQIFYSNISCTSLSRILHKDLGLLVYKVQLTQQLKYNDYTLCCGCSVCTFQTTKFEQKIGFSDERHFPPATTNRNATSEIG